jgi:hypothetical protein
MIDSACLPGIYTESAQPARTFEIEIEEPHARTL